MTPSSRPSADAADPVARWLSTATVADSSALDRIAEANSAMSVWTVVLDDDPTGTQSVANLPVLTPGFTDADLHWAAEQHFRTTFVLTNSRSVDAETAAALTTDVVGR